MKQTSFIFVCLLTWPSFVLADTFGAGANQFTIDFVDITCDASSANGTNIGTGKPEGFIDPGYDYRMGVFEITNDQWNKFVNAYGEVAGNPLSAYDEGPEWTDPYVPVNRISWYEAAQFVNWLNISTNHAPAYKFTGTSGQSDYAFVPWNTNDTGYDPVNPYRNRNAYYALPTEDEWVKAAYWNGAIIQTYSTISGNKPAERRDANYGEYALFPWDVGSGSKEINGTYDMNGNVNEWMENPYYTDDYGAASRRCYRGGNYVRPYYNLVSTARYIRDADVESPSAGFRVACVPEPGTLALLAIGGLIVKRRR